MLTDEEKFKRGNDHDEALLWKHLINHVNPPTCVLVSNLKDELKSGIHSKPWTFAKNVHNSCFSPLPPLTEYALRALTGKYSNKYKM
eukprot:11935471-Ditylum_brightwellii.AAC.1